MTDETIEKLIDSLNSEEAPDLIFLRPITKDVSFGRVWTDLPRGISCNEDSYSMFFIKDERQKYVAAVLDMGEQDLHVFVKPNNRKKGCLVNALRSVVLPFLFSNGRKEQRITFQSEEAKHHAQITGFSMQTKTSGIITPNDLQSVHGLSLFVTPPNKEQVERIKQRIRCAAALLRVAKDEVDAIFGGNKSSKLTDISRKVEDLSFEMHDYWRDQEKKEAPFD